jgi:catalase
MTDDRRARHTTNTSGAPTASDEHSLTAGPDGATVLHDHHLIEKLAQFNRERVPERVVHAKGGGAHGFFEVLEDVTQWTRAGFLSEVGRRTPVFARFSTVAGEHGYGDTDRDPRGFAVKLYTDEGNYDLVGNSTPVFFVRDAAKFPDFIHSQKRHPVTGLRSNDMQWDFWSLSPESAHQVIILMSGRGTPKTWRNMNGYGSHTYMWMNAGGERFWVKYHWKTAQGIENLTNAEARAMRAEDPDCHRRDLFNAIARREAPEWRLEMQVMPYDDAAGYRFNPFDVTKVWPHADYPPVTIGRLVLDRNPQNHFAEVEQAAFAPSNLVPGIGPSPDKMLMGRMFAYPDAHRHRIGTNYNQLPINAPRCPVSSYTFDGHMRHDHAWSQPTYAPNSYGGPAADPQRAAEPVWGVDAAELVRAASTLHAEDDDFGQARTLWREVMDDIDRDHLVDNVVEHLGDGVTPHVLERAIGWWTRIDADLGARVAAGLASRGGSGLRAAPAPVPAPVRRLDDAA